MEGVAADGAGGGGGGGVGVGGGAAGRFRTVLIDEASQATEPAALVPVLLGCEQLLLVGDQRQLPPTVTERSAAARGLGVSLFSRLQALGVEPLLLAQQYRMHPALADFPSRRFYGGRLQSAVDAADRPPPRGVVWPNAECAVAFVEVEGDERRSQAYARGDDSEGAGAAPAEAAGSGSYSNEAEAAALAEAVGAVLGAGELRAEDVGVITPYSAQVQLLQRKLQGLPARLDAGGVEVSTVDGFQGREKELILISTVRSNPRRALGFVADDRRLNVMITRARRGLVLFGDPGTLGSDETWRAYLQWLRKRRCVCTGPSALR